VGSDHGIAARDGSAWSRTEAAVYGGGRAISLQFDREQRLWVGRSTGASYLDGAAWRNFTDVELGASDIRQVLQDVRGQVWIASPTGLGYWNGSEWRQLGRLTGLASSDVREILEDSQSRLWTIGDHGLTRVIPDRTSPQTIFRLPQAAVTTSRTLSFAFGAAYDETADLEYEAYWDGARVQDWSATSSHQQEDVPDGWHTFAVRSRDWYRNEDPSAATVTFEVDATPPQAVLSSPLFRAPVQGEVAIVGSVTDARYRSHRLEVRPLGSAAWLTIAAGDSAVTLDTLARWDSRSAPDGDHEIRLSVLDELGLVGTALVQVIVDNVAPFADVTSPVRVRAAEGGDVFTTGSEVHAYFPPFAFDADATVQIEPDAEAGGPETLPDGAERVGPAWLLAWSEANLKSAGTLDMLAPPSEARPLAIYREDAPGTWRRLGGTPPAGGGRHSVGLQAPGRHALFAGGTTVPSAALSGVTLVPRAFSPHGTFGSRELSIGFTLGRAASVSVKVHDRAGRLLRVVADGLGMPAGEGVLRWDGRDRDGGTVPAGLYLVTIEASGERETRTLAVVR
jgi:hypothetical protein